MTARARTEASRFRSMFRSLMPGLVRAVVRNAAQRVLEELIGRPLSARELAFLEDGP